MAAATSPPVAGGAFLHPTHQLTDKMFNWAYPAPGVPQDGSASYARAFRLARDRATMEPAIFPDAKHPGD